MAKKKGSEGAGVKEKLIGAAGSLSGATGFLGSYQVCHNLCMGAIALLSLIGITVIGMPLLFLTRVAVPFWIAAVVLLLVTLAFYVKTKCVSGRLLLFNSGMVVAGVPFQQFQKFSLVLWSIGGALMALSVILFFKNRFFKESRMPKKAKRRQA